MGYNIGNAEYYVMSLKLYDKWCRKIAYFAFLNISWINNTNS